MLRFVMVYTARQVRDLLHLLFSSIEQTPAHHTTSSKVTINRGSEMREDQSETQIPAHLATQTQASDRSLRSIIPYRRSPLSWKMRSPGFPPPGDGGKSNLTGVMSGAMPFICN